MITDQTEGVTVEATARVGENYMMGASIAGSPESVTIAEYYEAIMPLQQRIKQAERDGRSLNGDKRIAAKEAVAAKVDSINALSLAFAEKHSGTLAALSALESLDATEHKDLFKANIDALKDTFRSSLLLRQNQIGLRPRGVAPQDGFVQPHQAKEARGQEQQVWPG